MPYRLKRKGFPFVRKHIYRLERNQLTVGAEYAHYFLLLLKQENCIGNNRPQAKKIVAITTYAPADRFFRMELCRVTEATIYGISIL